MALAAGSDGRALDAVAASARAGEPDRYLAALLAPAPARADLLAVAAFAAELGRVAAAVTREPAMADIRLQWWRDAVDLDEAQSTGNPVADALRATMFRHAIARETLIGVIDAHAADLEPDPFADDVAMDLHWRQGETALFAMTRHILGARDTGDDLPFAAGKAYGLARLLFALPSSLARGRVPVPQARLQALGAADGDLLSGARPEILSGLVRDLGAEARRSLASARSGLVNLPRGMRGAFHPLALVESYLRATERAAAHSVARVPDVAPITRIVRIAGAHWLGRL